jgi:hypothetical protein
MSETPKIIAWFEYPPIPVRQFDWGAYYEGHEESGPYGWGATEAEAINDLTDNHEAPDDGSVRETTAQ